MNEKVTPPSMKVLDDGRPDIRVLLLLREGTERQDFVGTLKALRGVNVRTFFRPKTLTPESLRKGNVPDILLLDVDLNDQADLKLIGDLRNEDFAVVALVDRTTELAALKAIRAGATDVLLKPIDPMDAHEVFARVANSSGRSDASALGRCVVFMHLSGGAGATTLAVNSAALLLDSVGKDEVCLIDFDLQFGNAANLLDLPASSSIQEIVDDPTRVDREMLESMMAKHSSGMRVLTAPRLPLPLSVYNADTVTNIIQIAKRRYRYVIVDLPVALAPWTDAVMREAAVIYIVSPPTLPAVHRVSQFLALLNHEGLHELPVKIVLNRHQDSRSTSDISESQFSKAIGHEIAHIIPNDYKLVALSHNQGQAAVRLRPTSDFSKALSGMLAADVDSGPKKEKKKSFLFGRR